MAENGFCVFMQPSSLGISLKSSHAAVSAEAQPALNVKAETWASSGTHTTALFH